MATKKVTTATTKDVTAKVTAPETKTSEKAETTKKAFEVVKETFSANDGEEKGPIIIATVEGDIHDIGKNDQSASRSRMQ